MYISLTEFSVLNDRMFKSIPCILHELFFCTISPDCSFQKERFSSVGSKNGSATFNPHSQSHATNPSSPAQRLCSRKGQVHVKNESFIWHVDKVPLSFRLVILLIPSPFFSFSLLPFLFLYAPLTHLPFFAFPDSPSPLRLCLPCRSLWSADAGWPVEHPVSVFFLLCFSYSFCL